MEPIHLSIATGVAAYVAIKVYQKRQSQKKELPSQEAQSYLPPQREPPRKKIMVEAVECYFCGKPFLPVNSVQKYCGDSCRNKASYYKNK